MLLSENYHCVWSKFKSFTGKREIGLSLIYFSYTPLFIMQKSGCAGLSGGECDYQYDLANRALF